MLVLKTIFFYNTQYLSYYLLLSFGLSLLMIGVSLLAGTQQPDMEKTSGYECGFDPFSDARDTFHIRFYLLAILFIIFDIEIVFFFPWILSINTFFLTGFYTMSMFLFILLLGFLYEWKKKALDWD